MVAVTAREIDEYERLEATGTLASIARHLLDERQDTHCLREWARLWKRLAKHRLRLLRPWRAQRKLSELQDARIERLEEVVTLFREHEGRPSYVEEALQRLDEENALELGVVSAAGFVLRATVVAAIRKEAAEIEAHADSSRMATEQHSQQVLRNKAAGMRIAAVLVEEWTP